MGGGGEVRNNHGKSICINWSLRTASASEASQNFTWSSPRQFGVPIAEQDNLLIVPSNASPSHRFGLPFVLHLEKTIAWDILQKEILEKMQYFLRPAACLQVRQMSSLVTTEELLDAQAPLLYLSPLSAHWCRHIWDLVHLLSHVKRVLG